MISRGPNLRLAKGDRAEEARYWLHRTNRDQNSDWLLEEYKTLRSEVTTSMQVQQSVLSFGTATLGVVFAAAFASHNREFLGVLLLVFAPLLCYLVLTIWVSEVLRMIRAGTYVMRIEKRADERFRIGALSWESTVFQSRCRRGPLAALTDPDRLRTLAITLLFLAIAGASITVAWHASAVEQWEQIFAISALSICLILLSSMLLLHLREKEELLRPVIQKDGERAVVGLVEEIQELLARHGFDPMLRPDEKKGVFGEGTEMAVKEFQEKRGLDIDGVVAPITWRELMTDLPKQSGGLPRRALRKRLKGVA